MGRIKTGWRLTKKSWSVLRSDRSLIIFPLLAALFATVAGILIFVPTVLAMPDPFHSEAVKGKDGISTTAEVLYIAATIVFAYISMTISVFFNVALAACAQRSFRGEDTSVAEGVAAARSRLGAIIGWAAVAATIGLILRAIEERFQLAGAIAAALLGAAWGIASFFAIPVIALEGVGPWQTLKRSAQIIREKWGEGFTGVVAIGLITMLVSVAVLIVGIAGAVLIAGAGAIGLGVVVGVITLIAVVIIGLISSALNQIFRVAVYEYAVGGNASGGFEAAELDAVFQQKRSLFRRK